MKTVVLFDHKGGRLANQLWLYANVLAFCLERGVVCKNICFYPFYRYFDITPPYYFIYRILVFLPDKAGKFFLKIIQAVIRLIYKSHILSDKGKECFLDLPEQDSIAGEILSRLRTEETLYLEGWLYRHEKGMNKYREEICNTFTPRPEFLAGVDKIISPLREKKKKIVGVHIRHGDYKMWQGGKFYFSFEEVRGLLQDFLSKSDDPENHIFVLCSDEPIDHNVFSGMPYVTGPGTTIGDLYTLARTDVILGSTSTFGAWAAYYGGIDFIQFTRPNS